MRFRLPALPARRGGDDGVGTATTATLGVIATILALAQPAAAAAFAATTEESHFLRPSLSLSLSAMICCGVLG